MSQQVSETLSPVEKVLCLQGVDVFKHATTEMLAYISSIAQEKAVARESVVFAEQEMSDAMYVVVRGRVRLEKEGKEIVTVGRTESFGTWALFDNAPRLMSAVALDDCLLLKILSDSFYEFLADHDEVTPAIFKAVIERVKALAPDAQ
jgi:CRP/FNR family transcriptional regulator, cyclic AMP receptor protein